MAEWALEILVSILLIDILSNVPNVVLSLAFEVGYETEKVMRLALASLP